MQSYDYYHDWVLKHILPPFVFSCITAALLLAFTLWRAIKLCRCVRCIRGPQRRARAAADTLGARRHRILQAAVCVLACGVVAGAGYGLSTIQPGLQPRGVGVFEQAKARARLLGWWCTLVALLQLFRSFQCSSRCSPWCSCEGVCPCCVHAQPLSLGSAPPASSPGPPLLSNCSPSSGLRGRWASHRQRHHWLRGNRGG